MKEPGPGDADIGRMMRLFAGSVLREEMVDLVGRIVEQKLREFLAEERFPPKGAKREDLAGPVYLTPKQVAGIMGYSIRTIQRLVEAGKLRPCGPKRNRFTRFEVDRFMSKTSGGPPESEDAVLADLDERMGRVK